MGKISERQKEKYKIWITAIFLAGVCLLLYYFHAILRIGTTVTHLFYVPIILASIWWKRKGLVVALFSSGFLIVSHFFLRPDVAAYNDYLRAFMFMVTAFVVAELSRRLAKKHEALQAANQQLRADEQQLRAANQQLKAANQQLRANEKQLVSEITERKRAENALCESEGKLSAMLQSVTDPMSMMDKDLNIIWANITAMKIFGDDIVGRKCYEAYHGRNKPCEPYPCLTLKAFQDGKIHEHDTQVVDKEGQKRYFHCIANVALRDSEGNPTTVLNISRDITGRKKAEDEIRKFKTLADRAGYGVGISDLDGNIVYVNSSFLEMHGYTADELIGKNLSVFHNEEQMENVNKLNDKLKREGTYIAEEVWHKRKDGTVFPTLMNGTLIRDVKGKPLFFGATAVDITERKQAEEALRESENSYKAVVENAVEGIVVVQGRTLQFVNPALVSMIGYSEKELLTRPFTEFIHPDHREWAMETHIKRLKGEKVPPVYEFKIVDNKGNTKWLENNGILIKWHDRPATLNFLRDITEQKLAKEQIERLAKFPSENPNPVLRVAQDGKVMYSNDPGLQLLAEWKSGIGTVVPERWQRLVTDACKSGNEGKQEEEFRDRVFSFVISPVVDSGYANLYGSNITERKLAEESLKYRMEFERLITMLSKRFIDPGDVDEKIDEALKAIGEFAKVDRAYVFQLRDDGRTVDNTNEWCAEGIVPQIENLRGIALDEELPWFWEKMKAHETFHVPAVAELPPEAQLEKKHYEMQDIQALVVVPMLSKGILKGFLGFDSIRSRKTWPEDIITLLRISGESLSLALDREHAEQRARLLSFTVEQSSEGMGVIGLQGNLLFLNNAFADMHGYTPEELIGSHISVFHTPEQIPSVEAANRQVKETGKFDGEIWHVRRDGTVFPCMMHNSLLHDEAGNLIGLIGAIRDITESKRAEQALRESEIKFRSLTEESLVGVYLIQDGIFKYVNPKFAEIFGYSADELIDKKGLDEVVFPEDWPLTQENLRRKIEGEIKSIQYNFRGITRDKKVIDIEVFGSATQYQGQPAVIGTLLDVTQRRRADEALQESELKFKTIFENAGGAIFIADIVTGKIFECNSQAEQLLGRPRAEIIGMHQSELHPQGEEGKYKEIFSSHVQKGHVADCEGEIQHRNGRKIPVWIAAQCLKIGGKNVLLGLFMDITERKKVEETLLEYQVRLKSLASQLSLIEERERHHIATELHDQIGQSLVMSKMKLDSLRQSISSSESTAVIKEISDCLGQIIQDTRTLTFDLSSPILYELGFEAAVAEWLDEQIREKHGIKTEFEDDGQPKPLEEDIRVLLFRNVRELLVNVVKHANAKNVKVSIWKKDKKICVRVEDGGVGFDVTGVESMVTQKAKFGLFSIQERLESVGGRFEIESEVGQGSRITMVAPLKSKKRK